MVMSMIYLLPMLLGRTFDVRDNKVGVDIFRQEDVDDPSITYENNLQSDYKRIKEISEAHKLLKISGELSLKVKSGVVDIKGSGSYLQSNEYRRDVVEILTLLTFKTVTKYLPRKAVPATGWENLPPQDLGTHYVSGITYGGRLLASLKFRAVDEKYTESIKAGVDAALQAGSAFDLVAKGKLDKLQNDLKGQASLEIAYFGTVPLRGVAHTVEGLRNLVYSFKDHVQEVNGGIGVPIQVELSELSTLNSRFSFKKNAALSNVLRKVEVQFDDLLQTESTVKGWLKKDGLFLTEDQEKKIDQLYVETLRAIAIFKGDINNLNVEKGPEQLDRSIDAYKKGGGNSPLPGKYRRMWDKIRQSLVVPEPQRNDGNSVYIRWGRDKCNGTNTQTLSKGFMATATREGSPPNAMCLPEKADFVDSITPNKNPIAGVRYGLVHLDPFASSSDLFDSGVRCSVCYAQGRSSVANLPATQCPEGWHVEYGGYYLASRKEAPKSEILCVDSSPDKYKPKQDGSNYRPEQSILAVTHRDQVVPCIVCSK